MVTLRLVLKNYKTVFKLHKTLNTTPSEKSEDEALPKTESKFQAPPEFPSMTY